MAVHLRLAEQPQLGVGLGQYGLEAAEADLFGVALDIDEDDAGGRRTMLVDVRDRQAENGACVQGEL